MAIGKGHEPKLTVIKVQRRPAMSTRARTPVVEVRTTSTVSPTRSLTSAMALTMMDSASWMMGVTISTVILSAVPKTRRRDQWELIDNTKEQLTEGSEGHGEVNSEVGHNGGEGLAAAAGFDIAKSEALLDDGGSLDRGEGGEAEGSVAEDGAEGRHRC